MTQDDKTTLFSEGLAIAITPLLGYLYAYLYFSGFFKFFGIPIDLINVTPTIIFVVAGYIISIFISLFYFFNFILMLFPESDNPNPITRKIKALFPVIFFAISFPVIYGTDWKKYVPILVFFPILLFIDFGFPLIFQHGKKTYIDKYIAQNEHEKKIKMPLLDNIFGKLGYTRSLLLLYFIFSLFIAYNAGSAKAEKQTEYMTIANTSQVVLKINGDKIITTNFDEQTKKIDKSFQIMTLDDLKGKDLIMRDVGPLSK